MLVTRPVEPQKRASLRPPSSSKGNPSSKSTKHTLTECMACSERKTSSKLLLVLCLKAQSVHVSTSPWHEPDVIFCVFRENQKLVALLKNCSCFATFLNTWSLNYLWIASKQNITRDHTTMVGATWKAIDALYCYLLFFWYMTFYFERKLVVILATSGTWWIFG